MTISFSRTALALMIALGGIGAGTVPAAADGGISLRIETRDGDDIQLRNRNHYGDERDWRGEGRRDGEWRGGRDGRRHADDRGRRGRCDPWLAIDKARAHGLRRADIAEVSRRRLIVEGRHHGRRHAIAFANLRGCPIIARW